jgi:hypothetical protein
MHSPGQAPGRCLDAPISARSEDWHGARFNQAATLRSLVPCSEGRPVVLRERVGNLEKGMAFPRYCSQVSRHPFTRSAFTCFAVILARPRTGFPCASNIPGVYMDSSSHISPWSLYSASLSEVQNSGPSSRTCSRNSLRIFHPLLRFCC